MPRFTFAKYLIRKGEPDLPNPDDPVKHCRSFSELPSKSRKTMTTKRSNSSSLNTEDLQSALQRELSILDNVCNDEIMNEMAFPQDPLEDSVFDSTGRSVRSPERPRNPTPDSKPRPGPKYISQYKTQQSPGGSKGKRGNYSVSSPPQSPRNANQIPMQSRGRKQKVLPTSGLKANTIIALDDQNRFKPLKTKEECVSILRGYEGNILPNPSLDISEKLEKFKGTAADTVFHYATTGEFLKELHDSGDKIADVRVSIGADVFLCHRIALACYSLYFKNLFLKSESYQKVPIAIRLRGIRPESFELFLKYIYTGELKMSPELAGDLIIMAEKLNIPILKERCIEFMDGMAIDQALRLIQYGIVSSSVALYDCVMACISDRFNELGSMREFLQLDVATTAMILSHDHLVLKSEMDVFKMGLRWIAHDLGERVQHLSRIMSCVRFSFMTHQELFECLQQTDLLADNAFCRDTILKANWTATARQLGVRDPLKLLCPKPRTAYCMAEMRKQSDIFYSTHDFNTANIQVEEVKPVGNYNPSSAIGNNNPGSGDIITIGGFQRGDKTFGVKEAKYVERYDTKANKWQQDFSELPEPRLYHAVTKLDNKMYVIGGTDPRDSFKSMPTPKRSVFIFDLDKKEWSKGAPLNTPRMFHSACSLFGMIYVLGGQDDCNRVLNSVECYNPKTNSWFSIRPMKQCRLGCSASAMDGKIFVVGGYGDAMTKITGSHILNTAECFDPRQNSWTELNNLRIPRCHANLVTVEGELYLCGGATKSKFTTADILMSESSIDKYDKVKGGWNKVADLVLGRHSAGTAVVGSKIYVMGGINTTANRVLRSMEVYDVKRDAWLRNIEELPFPAKWLSCVTVPCGI